MEYWDSGQVRHIRRDRFRGRHIRQGPGVPKRTVLATLLAAGGIAAGFAALETMPANLPGFASPPAVDESPDVPGVPGSGASPGSPWIWPSSSARPPVPNPTASPRPDATSASPLGLPTATPTATAQAPADGAGAQGLAPMGTPANNAPTASPGPGPVPSGCAVPSPSPDPSPYPPRGRNLKKMAHRPAPSPGVSG